MHLRTFGLGLSLLFLGMGAGCSGETVKARVQLGMEGVSVQRQGLSTPDGGTFQGCAAGVSACTPYDLSGRIYSAGAMWGELGPEARKITFIGGDKEEALIQGFGGEAQFSLIEATQLPGEYAAEPPGQIAKVISRMEFNYDYLDATVELSAGGPLDGVYVVRTVFVTEATAADVTGTMKRGDKLVRAQAETRFKWCGAQGCDEDRAKVAEPIQESKLVNHVFSGHGNPNYIPFAVPLSNQLSLTGDQINTPGQLWVVAFDMKNAVLLHQAPESLTTLSQLLQAFELSYSPDQQHQGQTTDISVSLGVQPPAVSPSPVPAP